MARHYALKLLGYKARSEKELEERLKRKGFTDNIVSSTINYLKSIGMVDDRSLAESLKREALNIKLLSLNGAKKFILSRGIPRDIVKILFSSDENRDIENSRKIICKKLKLLRNYSPDIVRRRIYNHLLRKGYSYDTIKSVFREIKFE